MSSHQSDATTTSTAAAVEVGSFKRLNIPKGIKLRVLGKAADQDGFLGGLLCRMSSGREIVLAADSISIAP
jgi:hypothetical protein